MQTLFDVLESEPCAPSDRRGRPAGRPYRRGALWLACSQSPAFFLARFGTSLRPAAQPRAGRPSTSGPARSRRSASWRQGRLAVILKARQLGMSWLTVGFALVAHDLPARRHRAALLAARRRGRPPAHLPPARHVRPPAAAVQGPGGHAGQRARVPPVERLRGAGLPHHRRPLLHRFAGDRRRGGPSPEDLDGLLNAVKPTIDAGGRLILLSTVDKTRPESPLKRIYRAALRGENDYTPIFLPWSANPARTPEWYAQQARDIQARTGGLDDLYQEYPATDLEALAPRAVDKYFPAGLLEQCYAPLPAYTMGDDEVAALQALADAAALAFYAQYARPDPVTGEMPPMLPAERDPVARRTSPAWRSTSRPTRTITT